MFLEPVEIQHVPLSRRWRGYDPEAVERLLELAAASYEEVWRERDALRERVEQLEREVADYRQLERLMRDSLVTAQRVAEELQERAQRESDTMLEQARASAEESLALAVQERDRLEEEARRLAELGREIQNGYRVFLTRALELLAGERRAEEEPAPAQVVEQATVVEEAPTVLEEAPTVLEEAPTVIEEKAATAVEETPAVAEPAVTVAEEEPTRAVQGPGAGAEEQAAETLEDETAAREEQPPAGPVRPERGEARPPEEVPLAELLEAIRQRARLEPLEPRKVEDEEAG